MIESKDRVITAKYLIISWSIRSYTSFKFHKKKKIMNRNEIHLQIITAFLIVASFINLTVLFIAGTLNNEGCTVYCVLVVL